MRIVTSLVYLLQVTYCRGQFDQFVYSPALIYAGELEKVTFKERQGKELRIPVVCQQWEGNSSLWVPLPTAWLNSYTIQCLAQGKSNNGSLAVRLWQGNKGVMTDAELHVIQRPTLAYFGPKRVSAFDQFVLKAVLRKDDLLQQLPKGQFVPTLYLYGSNQAKIILNGELFLESGEIIFVYSGNKHLDLGVYNIKLYLDKDMLYEVGVSNMEHTIQIVQPTVRLQQPYFNYDEGRNEIQVQLELNVPRLTDVKAVVQVQDVLKYFVWEAASSGLGIVSFQNMVFNRSNEPVIIAEVLGASQDSIASIGYIVQNNEYDIPVYRVGQFKDVYRGDTQTSIQAMPSFQSSLPSELTYKITSQQKPVSGLLVTQLMGQLQGVKLELDIEANWSKIQLQDRISLDIQIQQGWNSRIDPLYNNIMVEILGVETGNCPPGFHMRKDQQALIQKKQAPLQKQYITQDFSIYFEAYIGHKLHRVDVDTSQHQDVSFAEFTCNIPFGAEDLYVVLRSAVGYQPISWLGCVDLKTQPISLQINSTFVEWRHKIKKQTVNSSCSLLLIFEESTLTNYKHNSYEIPNRMLSLPTRRKSIRINLFQLTDPSHTQLKSLSLVGSNQQQALLCGNYTMDENEWYVGECSPNVLFSVTDSPINLIPEPLFPDLAVVQLDRKFNSTNVLPAVVTAEDGMSVSSYGVYFLQNDKKFQNRLTSVDELCVVCSPGRFSSVQNAQYCLPCGAGSYSDKSGSASCELCPVGTYAQKVGSTECKECLQGTFASSNGSSICEVCKEGSVTLYEGSATCMDRDEYLTQLNKEYKVVVSFALWLNGTSWEDIDAKTINLGVNASSNTILSLLLQADTARLFNISFQDVQVMSLREVQTRSLSENSTMIQANITATLHKECDNRGGKKSFQECVDLMHNDADHALYELSGGGAMRQIDSVLDVDTEFDEDEYYIEEHPATHQKMPALEVILLPTISGTIMAIAALGVWIRLKQKQVQLCGWRFQPRYKRQA